MEAEAEFEAEAARWWGDETWRAWANKPEHEAAETLEAIDDARVFSVIHCSVEREDCPAVKGLVRGHVRFEGFVISPTEEGCDSLRTTRQASSPSQTNVGDARSQSPTGQAPGCTATYIVSTDPKGWIPAFVANQVATRQTHVLTHTQ